MRPQVSGREGVQGPFNSAVLNLWVMTLWGLHQISYISDIYITVHTSMLQELFALSSVSCTYIEMLCMVSHFCNSVLERQRQKEPRNSMISELSLIDELQASDRPSIKGGGSDCWFFETGSLFRLGCPPPLT